jgi:hypothetical protein
MIPISCYEALAAGRHVISTPRDWPFKTEMVKTGSSCQDIAALIYQAVTVNKKYSPYIKYTRKDWAVRQVMEAQKLCK